MLPQPTPREVLAHCTQSLLGDGTSFGAQLGAVQQLHALFVSLGGVDAHAMSMSSQETTLEQGLALGPVRAAQAASDFLRTRVLLRGVRRALERASARGGPVNVLYAGCGPYAMLALPLMAQFPSVRWTLLDLHEPSVASARAVLKGLGLLEHVEDVQVANGCTWEARGRAFHGLVCEAMQAGLCVEDHVGLCTHLVPQLVQDAFMVPWEVEVDAALSHVQRITRLTLSGEVPADWLVPLGRVATLNMETARAGRAAVLHGMAGVLPQRPSNGEFALELHTRVHAYDGERLEGLQCAITAPRVLAKPSQLGWGQPFAVRYSPSGPPQARLEVPGAASGS